MVEGKSKELVVGRGRLNVKLVLAIVLLGTVGSLVYYNFLTISYFLRPVWDKAPQDFKIVPHYYAENVSLSQLCYLHGWTLRQGPRRVFDAIIFSNELELVEIRYHELLPHVTKFVLVESEHTFTGKPKALHFAENRQRFDFLGDRLAYGSIRGRELAPGEDPFNVEREQRIFTAQMVRNSGIQPGDLLIMADGDEIPSAHTVKLLQWCDGWPSPMHLQLNNYLYSMEFLVDQGSWRSSVHVYDPESTGYTHSRRSEYIYADSGWHCSFCYRHIKDFIFKMTAYSHADRVRYESFLDPERIQSLICEGKDLFDMLPEEYTFRQLISKIGNVPSSYSAVHLPSYLLQNADHFKFLLPGSCIREPD